MSELSANTNESTPQIVVTKARRSWVLWLVEWLTDPRRGRLSTIVHQYLDRISRWALHRYQLEHDQQLALLQRDFERRFTELRSRIDNAIATSEADVLATGECVTSVLTDAREHAASAKASLARVDQNSELAVAIERQTDAMRDFLDELRRRLEASNAMAQLAERHTTDIMLAGDQIAGVARAAKLLNVNAQIEAARLGASGSAFAVIAQEMGELTGDIEKANRSIGHLASTLREHMPKLAETTRSLTARADSFFGEFNVHQEAVTRVEGELQNANLRSLQESEERANATLATSQRALSHLQFQDPMAQSLRKAESSLKEFRTRLERLRDRMLLSSAELLEQAGADLSHYGSYYVENRLQKEAELAAIDARDAVLLQQSAERRRAKAGKAPATAVPTSKSDAAEPSNVVDMRRNPPPDEAAAAGELMMFGDDEDEDAEKKKDDDLDTPESGDVMLF